MMSRRRIHDFDGLPLFADATARELVGARSLLTALAVDGGVTLFHAGHLGREFAIIVNGQVGVSGPTAEFMEVLGPGEMVGELALLGARWRRATVTTLTPVLLYVGGEREFDALLQLVPSLREGVVRVAMARLGA